jgi:hypothetical protein
MAKTAKTTTTRRGTIHLAGHLATDGTQCCTRCGTLLAKKGGPYFDPEAVLERTDGTMKVFVGETDAAHCAVVPAE